jgi:hypothetical protein
VRNLYQIYSFYFPKEVVFPQKDETRSKSIVMRDLLLELAGIVPLNEISEKNRQTCLALKNLYYEELQQHEKTLDQIDTTVKTLATKVKGQKALILTKLEKIN